MTIETIGLGLLALPAVNTLWLAYATVRLVTGVSRVPAQSREPSSWPKVSIVVPACNEADGLEAATRAKLACDYPNLELVLVEDRSTDETPAIADRLAAEDPRIRVVHVTELPAGWLGKLDALHRGVGVATGDWLLFSDADVHIGPSLLRRTIAAAEEEGLDFVAMIPEFWSNGFLLDVLISAFTRMLCTGGRLWSVPDPRSRASAGGGIFNLVRRSAFDKTRGFEWLKLEIADDVALGQMMKRSGARCRIYNAVGELTLHYYRSLREAAYGFEKNGFAVLGAFSLARHLLVTALVLYVELAPIAALAIPAPHVRFLAATLLFTVCASQVALARWSSRPIASALVPSLGVVLLMAFMLRSAIVTTARGGIVWRGTHYSIAELRAGRRLEPY